MFAVVADKEEILDPHPWPIPAWILRELNRTRVKFKDITKIPLKKQTR